MTTGTLELHAICLCCLLGTVFRTHVLEQMGLNVSPLLCDAWNLISEVLLKQWLQKGVQNACERLSKEDEIAKTSTEQDVKYKSKDSQRMAAARLRGLLTRKRTRSGSLTVAQPTLLQFTPSRSLRCTSSARRKQKKSCT